MNPFKLEAIAAKQFRRFLSFPVAPYERQGARSFKKGSCKFVGKLPQVHSLKSSLVLLGDDASSATDQMALSQLLLKYLPTKAILLTDRIPSAMQKEVNQLLSATTFSKARLWRICRSRKLIITRDGLEAMLRAARKKQISIICLKTHHKFRDQDNYIVRKVDRFRKRACAIGVWTGAVRLAPANLPKLFLREKVSPVVFSLHAPSLRERLKRSKGWVRFGANQYYSLEGSPVRSVELWHRIYSKAPRVNIENLSLEWQKTEAFLARKTKLPKQNPPKALFHPFDINFFRFVSQMSKTKRAFLLERVSRGESVVLPQDQFVLMGSIDLGEFAEEVLHYMRLRSMKNVVESFPAACFEEALGFLASRWIDEERALPKVKVGDSIWGDVHREGYAMGAKLHRMWVSSEVKRKRIQKFFRKRYRNEREALWAWVELQAI